MLNTNELRDLYRAYAKAYSFKKEPINLYEPVDYIMNLGGKNIRAILTLSAYQMFDENIEQALPYAHAIELFHNFSLVHDDIMDEAEMRRGKPSVHQKFGINTGILSGDIMLIHVFKILGKIENEKKRKEVLEVFTQAAIDVCEGQQYDVDFENRNDVSIEQYIKMISLKTAVLLAAALKIGAQLAGANESESKLIYDFGWHAGIAFQIQDDILDAYGDVFKIGKRKGGDIIQNKKTILYLEALANLDSSGKQSLEALFSEGHGMDDETKIKEVLGIFDGLNVKEKVAKTRDHYMEVAFAKLDIIDVSASHKEQLRGIVDFFVKRDN